MKIVDKKGRLLGIINIIDLAVVVLLVLIFAAALSRFTGVDERHQPGAAQVKIEAQISEVRDYTVEAVQVGDVARDVVTQEPIGTIVDKRVEPYRQSVETADGRVVWAEVPERYDIYITLEGSAHDLGNAIRAASQELRVGSRVQMVSRNFNVIANILLVEVEE